GMIHLLDAAETIRPQQQRVFPRIEAGELRRRWMATAIAGAFVVREAVELHERIVPENTFADHGANECLLPLSLLPRLAPSPPCGRVKVAVGQNFVCRTPTQSQDGNPHEL